MTDQTIPSNNDPESINAIKQKGALALSKVGWARHDALTALSSAELGAIGTMIDAVINFYTGAGPTLNPDVLKTPEKQLLAMYTPEIGNYLADLGDKYKAWLKETPEEPMNPNDKETIESYLAGMETGESMGSKNLWDDMSSLRINSKDPQKRAVPVELTHLAFDDGNQNGIFLQSLFFGNKENTFRLGTYTPSLNDMRGFAMESFMEKIGELTKDDPEAKQGWVSLFKELAEKDGAAQVASDLFKAPLMQNAYGKDASMFGEMVMDFFESERNAALVKKHLGMYTGSGGAAVVFEMAGIAVEHTLRTIIDTANTNTLKAIGRSAALTNTVLNIEGPTGDTLLFTPVGIAPQYLDDSNSEVWKAADGTLRKIRSLKTTNIKKGPETISFPEEVKVLDPNATKGRQYFWNSRKKKYDYFDNPLGSAQQRLGPVMLIQSLDGDLVKLTTMLANRGRAVPYPAMWVHDSIISSPGSALIYRNVYNNIAIPAAVPWMKTAASKITDAWRKGHQEAFKMVEHMDAVGIGPEGEFPSVGAYFDEMWEKAQDTSGYKEVFMSRKTKGRPRTEEDWEEYQKRINAFLDEARSFGYRAPGDIGPSKGFGGVSSENDRRAHLAVTPSQFRKLVELADEALQLTGADGVLTRWNAAWAPGIDSNFKYLMNSTSVKNAGLAQMTPTGGSGPKVFETNKPTDEDNDKRPLVEDKEDPFFTGSNIPKPVKAPGYEPPKKEIGDVFAGWTSDIKNQPYPPSRGNRPKSFYDPEDDPRSGVFRPKKKD